MPRGWIGKGGQKESTSGIVEPAAGGQRWNRRRRVPGPSEGCYTPSEGRASSATVQLRGFPKNAMKRILAIDGGGIRGLIPALVCQAIESYVNQPISQLFDLIAGTSTGGILALGYAVPPKGMTAANLVKRYKKHGDRIFANPKGISNYWRPRYNTAPLNTLLKEYFHEFKVSDAVVEVMVTTYDVRLRRARVLKRWRAREDAQQDCLMWQAARGTSAAPAYFEPATISDGILVDGGGMANNPAGLALAEASRLWPGEELILASLGTGELSKSILEAKTWGKLQWAVPVLDCMFDGASKATHYMMRNLLPHDNYWRFQTQLTEAVEKLDCVAQSNIVELERIGRNLVDANRDRLSHLVSRLTATTAELKAQIDRPHERQVVEPGECKVYGSVQGYTGQRLYLMTGKEKRFWPTELVRLGIDNGWEGKVNLGSHSPTGTISLVAPDDLLTDYFEFYLKNRGKIDHTGIELSAPPNRLAEVNVVVDLGKLKS